MVTEADLDDLISQVRDLAKQYIRGEISASTFIEQYPLGYYEYALDGHERDPSVDILRTTRRSDVELLGRLQEFTNDMCDPPPEQREMYRLAGRILPEEAWPQLAALIEQFGAARRGPSDVP